MNIILELENVSKVYTENVGVKINLMHNISFKIEEGKVTSILAPTGAGKSSLLKIISDLEDVSGGEVLNKTRNRAVYIPSQPSSFPWLNVKGNIELALKEFGSVDEIIRLVGLEGYEEHYPDNKSLGFRFRISLARALAVNPSLIVIDEPFNQMDSETKTEIYSLIRKINSQNNQSFLLGTTNISEAIFLSDKIVLLKKNPGEIIEEIDVELPKDRGIEIINSSEFQTLRERIEKTYKSNQTQKLFNLSI